MNQWVNAQTAWLPSGVWESLPVADPISVDTEIVVGFDGSFSGDSTALVGVTVEATPRVWLIEAWEKQQTDTDDWRVDIAAVEAKIAETCRDYRVIEVVCDPFRWQRSMQEMAANGLPIVEYNSSSPARMVPATAKTLRCGHGWGDNPRPQPHAHPSHVELRSQDGPSWAAHHQRTPGKPTQDRRCGGLRHGV
jgi:phage terminase large subunit-like protein